MIRWVMLFSAASVLILSRSAHADVVTDWNEIMIETVNQAPDPAIQTRTATIMQVAVFEAVNSIQRDYEPYYEAVDAVPGASAEAAAVAAAHRVLVTLHPDSAGVLDGHRTASLAAIPDGKSEQDGLAVGEAAAKLLLTLRAADGFERKVPYTPGNKPGDWQPTPPDFIPAFMPGLGEVDTFAIGDVRRFRSPPPPALRSNKYARDYEEVKRVGSVDSSARPPDRTAVARFYGVNDVIQVWSPAARQVSLAQGRSLSENARTFALMTIAIFDAAVGVFDVKYRYNLWRPITAIRAGDRDGNRKTAPDPQWTPLIPTPPFPSYSSGHGGLGNAARRVLEELLGPDGHSITLTDARLPGITLRYSNWKDITADIDDARVYGGVHYRFDQEAAAIQGRRIGANVLAHQLRPSCAEH